MPRHPEHRDAQGLNHAVLFGRTEGTSLVCASKVVKYKLRARQDFVVDGRARGPTDIIDFLETPAEKP